MARDKLTAQYQSEGIIGIDSNITWNFKIGTPSGLRLRHSIRLVLTRNVASMELLQCQEWKK